MLNRFFSVITYLTHPLIIFYLFITDTFNSGHLSVLYSFTCIAANDFSSCFCPHLSDAFYHRYYFKRQGVQGFVDGGQTKQNNSIFYTLYYVVCYYFLLKLLVSSVIKILILAAACCIVCIY